MSEVHNVVIVGSGPAGYTAAIYAARAQLSPILYEGSVTAGGALMNTTEVENFPGFPAGVMGPDLMDSMRKQCEKFGTKLVTDDIVSMDLSGEIKTLTDGSGNILKSKSVILATGSAYKEIGLVNEKRLSSLARTLVSQLHLLAGEKPCQSPSLTDSTKSTSKI